MKFVTAAYSVWVVVSSHYYSVACCDETLNNFSSSNRIAVNSRPHKQPESIGIYRAKYHIDVLTV